jgi:hypothetical protein
MLQRAAFFVRGGRDLGASRAALEGERRPCRTDLADRTCGLARYLTA